MTDEAQLLDIPISPEDASDYLLERWSLRRSPRTLRGYRRDPPRGGGPMFFRIGNDVRYTRRLLDDWASRLMGQPFSSTTEESARRLLAAKEG